MAKADAFRRLPMPPPAVTSQEMRRLDHWAAREFHVPATLTMEEAGRALAEFVWRRYDPAPDAGILLLAGKGLNGASVLAAGRRLAHRGHAVTALLSEPSSKAREEVRRQVASLRKEGGHVPARMPDDEAPDAAFVLDGLVGYGLLDAPGDAIASLIRAANELDATRVANDVPSGLHPDTGQPRDPTFQAHATVCMGLPKAGVLAPEARPFVGELYLADVGFPRGLYADFDATPEGLFGRDILAAFDHP